jgi:hypothetical protein
MEILFPNMSNCLFSGIYVILPYCNLHTRGFYLTIHERGGSWSACCHIGVQFGILFAHLQNLHLQALSIGWGWIPVVSPVPRNLSLGSWSPGHWSRLYDTADIGGSSKLLLNDPMGSKGCLLWCHFVMGNSYLISCLIT